MPVRGCWTRVAKPGLTVAAEGFADRAYEADGSLTSRSIAGSVITDVDAVVARAVTMVRDKRVQARNGAEIPLQVDTICVHGDTPGADRLAAALHAGLERAGIDVTASPNAASAKASAPKRI